MFLRLKSGQAGQQRGFTLIEMMIVISLILILVSVAIPIYNRHLTTAREAVLKQDLFSMRSAIDQYTLDKQKAPQSLDDLVSAGYLHQIPLDPFTNSHDTWQTDTQADVIMTPDQTEGGITDVHSGSSLTALDGTPYNSW